MAQESTHTTRGFPGATPADASANHSSNTVEKVVDGAVSKPLGRADARTVYGEPVTHGDRTVIPVAKVSSGYGFGVGSGQGSNRESDQQGAGEGGAGGGKLDVKPIGYIEITSGKSQFMPIVDVSAIALRAITLFGIAAIIGVWAASHGGNEDD